jgi:hypothetical protein
MTDQEDIERRRPRPEFGGLPLRVFVKERGIWIGMISRCHNPASASYRWYGAKGVIVCFRWRQSFAAFLRDMGPRPSPKHSIDRIDPTGNYEPTNCRWATQLVQARNKRPRFNPLLVEYNKLLVKLGKL